MPMARSPRPRRAPPRRVKRVEPERVSSRPSFPLAAALASIAGTKRLLIYMHDNPDPDALAAAFGLKILIEHELGAEVTLALGGSSAAPRTAPWSRR
jgi:hypothetical protein